MIARLRSRLSYANVTATLALFVALGGTTAYAANTVFSTDIVDNQVFPADIRNDNLSGGGIGPEDLAPNSVTSSEVRDDTLGFGGLTSADLRSGSVTSSELAPFTINEGDIAPHVIDNRHINPGTLNDEDISQGAFVNFTGSIGVVPAQSCVDRFVTGVNAAGDHLLLTPNFADTSSNLEYSAQHSAPGDGGNAVAIHVCNHTAAPIDDGNTRFNLLVIDAQ